MCSPCLEENGSGFRQAFVQCKLPRWHDVRARGGKGFGGVQNGPAHTRALLESGEMLANQIQYRNDRPRYSASKTKNTSKQVDGGGRLRESALIKKKGEKSSWWWKKGSSRKKL